MSLGCLATSGFLAWHHPLAPVLATALLVVWIVAVFVYPLAWLFIVPALLPIVDLAQWTGWLVVEEFDILVLGAAAGAYASMAWRGGIPHDGFPGRTASGAAAPSPKAAPAAPGPEAARLSGISAILIGLFGVSTLLALYRGIHSAGSMDFGWFDGYYDAANSLRIAKSYLLALLMLPPLLAQMRRSGMRAIRTLAAGLTTGLLLASLAILWERLTFPGLLNFSSDYRVTAQFWEMHVGGAALDGFLALTLPFAIFELLAGRNRGRSLLAGGTVMLAGYACLVTFSRGVYLAVPVSLMLLAMLLARRRNSWSLARAARTLGQGCLLALAMAAMSYLTFRSGGYRALLAVLGVFAASLPLAAPARGLPASRWIVALAAGVLLAAAGSLVASLLPKGVYLMYGLAFAGCALSLLQLRRSSSSAVAIAALAAYVWLTIAAALVALNWGGARALQDTAPVLGVLTALMIWNARSRTGPWPRDLRTQAVVIGMAALTGVTAAVFSGGAYMSERFASSEQDAAGRMQHWRDGIGMLNTPTAWLLGVGAGRFPETYLFSVGDREFPGSSRIGEQEGKRYLILSGPRHEGSFGEMFRVTQQVQVTPGGQYSIDLDARAPESAQLHLELCQRHLLYVDGCTIAKLRIAAGDGAWRKYVARFDAAKLGGDPWYAPRPIVFAMATESPQSRIEIAKVSVVGQDDAELLSNRNFAEGMSRWFTVSDRLHLPWHIKNVGLNVLFDQGALGLLLWLALCGSSLYRLAAGSARMHPMAPFAAAALAGFLVVGLFDSLLDVPRLAFMFYLVTFVGLLLRPGNHGNLVQPTNGA